MELMTFIPARALVTATFKHGKNCCQYLVWHHGADNFHSRASSGNSNIQTWEELLPVIEWHKQKPGREVKK
jgi:hypothetical protein